MCNPFNTVLGNLTNDSSISLKEEKINNSDCILAIYIGL